MTDSKPPDRGAKALLVAGSFVVVVAGLKAAAPVLLPTLVATFLAVISLPLLYALRQLKLFGRNLPSGLTVLLTVVADFAVVGALVLVAGSSVKDFREAAPKYRDRIAELSEQPVVWLKERGFEDFTQIPPGLLQPDQVLTLVQGLLSSVTDILSNVLLVLLMLVFALMEAARLPDKLRLAFRGQRAPERFNKITREILTYLGVKTILSVATGFFFGLWLWIQGVDFPVLWGFLAFMLNYIPNFGSLLAALPPALLALVQFGPAGAGLTVLGSVVVNQVLGNIIEPALLGRQLGLSPLVVIVSLAFWGWVWGGVGMLLSVPLTMVVKILLENTEDLKWAAILLEADPTRQV